MRQGSRCWPGPRTETCARSCTAWPHRTPDSSRTLSLRVRHHFTSLHSCVACSAVAARGRSNGVGLEAVLHTRQDNRQEARSTGERIRGAELGHRALAQNERHRLLAQGRRARSVRGRYIAYHRRILLLTRRAECELQARGLRV